MFWKAKRGEWYLCTLLTGLWQNVTNTFDVGKSRGIGSNDLGHLRTAAQAYY